MASEGELLTAAEVESELIPVLGPERENLFDPRTGNFMKVLRVMVDGTIRIQTTRQMSKRPERANITLAHLVSAVRSKAWVREDGPFDPGGFGMVYDMKFALFEEAAAKIRVAETARIMAQLGVGEPPEEKPDANKAVAADLFNGLEEVRLETLRSNQRAGIRRAKMHGRYRGRPPNRERNARIAEMLGQGASYSEVQRATGCSRATVARIAKTIPHRFVDKETVRL